MRFIERLTDNITATKTLAVLGIDPVPDLIPGPAVRAIREDPARGLVEFLAPVIDLSLGLIPAVKFQSAYFELWGPQGMEALRSLLAYARERGLVTILDAKCGDVDSTSRAYAEGYLGESGYWPVDALTVTPYMGEDSLAPFIETAERTGTGVFVCVRTSNPGGVLQEVAQYRGDPLYAVVANMIASKNKLRIRGHAQVGAVVGATVPYVAATVRRILPDAFFLVPGMQTQGGSPENARLFAGSCGRKALFPGSRALLFPKADGPWSYDAVASAIRRHADHVSIERIRDPLEGAPS